MSESGCVALPDVWEWLGNPPNCPGVVGRPYWISGSGRVALPVVREWSGGPPGCTGEVRIPSWMSGKPSRISGGGGKVLSNVRE